MSSADETTFEVLEPPRHACGLSGCCCTGNWIEVDDDELPRIRDAAVHLGVDEPIVDGGLRLVEGVCVFLDDDRSCRIHGALGGEVKPIRCQQFPLVTVQTESGLRAGIDPACATCHRTWRDGPIIEPGEIVIRQRPLDAAQVPAERALLSASYDETASVPFLLHLLCVGRPGGPELPPGFAARWLERLHAADVGALTAKPDTGPLLRAALRPLVDGLATWSEPPPWPGLADDQDAFAREAMRRMLFLRLAPFVPVLQGVALLTLGGAVALRWATDDAETWGEGFSAWCRLVRRRDLWQALTPDAETMRWLATGERA